MSALNGRQRPGFTLLELIVAIAVGAIVLLGARALADRLGDSASTIGASSRSAAAAMHDDRELRAIVGQMEVATDGSVNFGGSATEAHFNSWCRVAAGWEEPCAVTLSVTSSQTSAVLVDATSGRPPTLDTIAAGATLLYLARADGGGSWIRRWGDGVTVPIAIGIATPRDTTILRIGSRG